jgi:DNA-binding response OmpR family regulator/anti-sigma regulatory factor (Ser/Thr protein kinase)
VDDNADMRDYIIGLLSADYDIRSAPDGQAALDLARAEPPDLVLTDVMMPRLDGFGLLDALRGDQATMHIPIVMLSARSGDDATVEGLEAGADDYLVKPFAARELRARVRSNLELDRTRRTKAQLARSQVLLDQAQRLAGVGSWEVDIATDRLTASDELLRQLQLTEQEVEEQGLGGVIEARAHPDDRAVVRAAFADITRTGGVDYEVRLDLPDGQRRVFRTIGEVTYDEHGTPIRVRGSNQDVTEQRATQRTLAIAAAAQEAASREHRIADELQRSLLPPPNFDPDHLSVATYYRAGAEGTQVGGDWYDVIELGAGRTALVLGDVMGRGVRAASVMGQLRAAVRAYARLDLPPADLLEFLDGVVRDLDEEQIVTCLYAVYDPSDGVLAFANAGHLPPLLMAPGRRPERLAGAGGPPLGTGLVSLSENLVLLEPGSLLALYTDGLVERRGSDIDAGIDRLAETLAAADADLPDLPGALVAALLDEPDDDIAVLLAQVSPQPARGQGITRAIPSTESAVADARRSVVEALERWEVPGGAADDVVLLASELVTNAVVHGRGPIELRLRTTSDSVTLDVRDRADVMPRRRRPAQDDEHGRGLQLVSLLADRWGTRPLPVGKSVWCVVRFD